MQRQFQFVAVIALCGALAMGAGPDRASANPRSQIGRTGFSEVSVPQVKGRVPARATSASAPARKSGAQLLPEGGSFKSVGANQPETCGPDNADTPKCRNIAAQQSHR